MFISSLASSSKSFFFHEVFLYRKYLESSFYIFYADDVKLISCWVIDSGNIAIIRFQCLETAKNHFDVVECKWAMFVLCRITGSPGLQKIAQTVHWSFFTLHACSQCSMRCAFQWNLFKYISKVIDVVACFVLFFSCEEAHSAIFSCHINSQRCPFSSVSSTHGLPPITQTRLSDSCTDGWYWVSSNLRSDRDKSRARRGGAAVGLSSSLL